MEISDILGLNQSGASPFAPTSERILGKDDFLRLLVTQLRNQNPLEPMEADDFSAQLAQFSSLEQLSNMNKLLEASLETNLLLATSVNNTLAASVIGKQVKALGSEVYFDGKNEAPMIYELGGAAKTVKIEILDENGKTVRTVNLDNLTEGEQNFGWDGKDDNGNRMSAGNYDFRITATGTDGQPVRVVTYMTGVVTGLRYGSDGPSLMIGNTQVRLADVLEIMLPNTGDGGGGGGDDDGGLHGDEIG